MTFRNALLASSLAVSLAFTSDARAQQSQEPLPDAPQATAAARIVPNGPTIVMDTSMGRITCQFFQKEAPKAVANFIALTQGTRDWADPTTKKTMHNKPLYDGTIFHRVIPEFMIQGGDPAGTGEGGPGYEFGDEFNPDLGFDVPGRLAMANSGPGTNGSQFFITEVPTPHLNQHHTIFGQCDEPSVNVVKTIARVQADRNDKPVVPVVLKKVAIVPEGQPLPPSPGAAADLPKRISISPEVAQGMLIKRIPLAYPQNAKDAHISGTVEMKALIGTDGKIKDLSVISGPDALQ